MVEKYPQSFDLKQPVPSDPSTAPPKVSVLITTYNQEKLISQAVNSVLSQEVNFSYEIVIGEDASSDRTREIVVELGRQHSQKVRVLLRDPQKNDAASHTCPEGT